MTSKEDRAKAQAEYNHGVVLTQHGSFDEAIAAYKRAIALEPDYVEAHNGLGAALGTIGRPEEAQAACERALKLSPHYPQAHHNLCGALLDQRRLDEALASANTAIKLQSDYAPAYWTRGLIHLLQGNLEQGWPDYEWRWKCEGRIERRNFLQPLWTGEPIAGKTLLLHTEQGMGDAIQFIRYVPMMANFGCKIILECPRELRRLLQGVPGITNTIQRNEPLPSFDLHCPLLNLPMIFKTTLQTIPATVPYLKQPQNRTSAWASRLAREHRKKIGLVWAGHARHPNDRNRSLRLDQLTDLISLNGATFYSLQKGEPAKQSSAVASKNLTDWTGSLTDFADTAALAASLDLIITADTAGAHLAGAIAKPVWVLLPYIPDWRWMLDRTDSPWYPTMRLFRQPQPRDWDTPIRQVVEALGELIA